MSEELKLSSAVSDGILQKYGPDLLAIVEDLILNGFSPVFVEHLFNKLSPMLFKLIMVLLFHEQATVTPDKVSVGLAQHPLLRDFLSKFIALIVSLIEKHIPTPVPVTTTSTQPPVV